MVGVGVSVLVGVMVGVGVTIPHYAMLKKESNLENPLLRFNCNKRN